MRSVDVAVTFDSERLLLDGRELPFDPYYFAIAAEYMDSDTEWEEVVKRALRQWATALSLLAAHERLFLPFGVYDQCTECLTAQLSKESAEQVVLKRVWTLVEGHSIDLCDMNAFLHQRHLVVDSAKEDFGMFPRLKLTAGLTTAQAMHNATAEPEIQIPPES